MGTKNRGCIILLVDQSGSMTAALGGSSRSRSEEAARAINACLFELCLACRNGDAFKDRCDVGIIGYGNNVGSILSGTLAGQDLVSIQQVAFNPAREDYVKRKISDGAGSFIEVDDHMPIWIEPVCGGGTPMDIAFGTARAWAESWIRSNPRSFPPVVVNVTDGAPNDPDAAKAAAERLRSLHCEDGNVLLFNVHVSSSAGRAAALPTNEADLPDAYGRFLFDISSVMPDSLLSAARQQGLEASPGSHVLIYNADIEYMVKLLRFGTVGTMGVLGPGDGSTNLAPQAIDPGLLEA